MGPPDAILGVTTAFQADQNAHKINLGVGAYRDAQGKPFVLQCVKEAQKAVAVMNHEYGPIGGTKDFQDRAAALLLGEDSATIRKGNRVTVQTLSGTGALRVAGQYLQRFLPEGTKIFLPKPTWANHTPIFKDSGLDVQGYRYYKDGKLDFDGMMEDLDAVPEGSVVLLHACAHNPTGVDPSLPQWRALSKALALKKRVVLFDCAYQGFASGDPRRDAGAIDAFLEDGHQPLICQSFAKNFGLYGQRVGALTVVTNNADEASRVGSQLNILIRPMYSNPPVAGARIVSNILGDPGLTSLWREEVKTMADRIIGMRTALRENLAKAGSDRDWSHITDQIGMFCYTGVNADQVALLAKDHSVYLTKDGRISIAGVTPDNVEHLAKSMHAVTKQ